MPARFSAAQKRAMAIRKRTESAFLCYLYYEHGRFGYKKKTIRQQLLKKAISCGMILDVLIYLE